MASDQAEQAKLGGDLWLDPEHVAEINLYISAGNYCKRTSDFWITWPGLLTP